MSFPTSVPNFAAGDVVALKEFMRPIVAPWLRQAWCAIVDPLQKNVVDDPVTGVITSVTVDPIWTGFMRVKALRTDVTVKKAVNSTTQRVVQFQPVDFADVFPIDVRAGLEIVVMDGLNDPWLEEYRYLVAGSLNSSEAWNRTINCFVNEESRPDYDTSGWPQKPVE